VITDLGLIVALWVIGCGETVDDPILGAEVCHILAGEVGFMVEDDSMRKPKATNDVLSKELHYLLSRDLEERHHLYPLSEISRWL